MATTALTTLAFPQPLIDPGLKINITMNQYLHLIFILIGFYITTSLGFTPKGREE